MAVTCVLYIQFNMSSVHFIIHAHMFIWPDFLTGVEVDTTGAKRGTTI